MTCRFRDEHKDDRFKLAAQRMDGMEDDKILYADDTICVSQGETAMNILLSATDTEGVLYGFRLNMKKCEYLNSGPAGIVCFTDGTPVSVKPEVKHLGCHMSDHGDPEREVNKIIKECMATLQQLQMFDVIVRAKVMYSLEN